MDFCSKLYGFVWFLWIFISFYIVLDDFEGFLYNFETSFDEKSRTWPRFNENRRRLVRIDPRTKNKHFLRSNMLKKAPKWSKKAVLFSDFLYILVGVGGLGGAYYIFCTFFIVSQRNIIGSAQSADPPPKKLLVIFGHFWLFW